MSIVPNQTPGQQMENDRPDLDKAIEQAHHDATLLITMLSKRGVDIDARLKLQAYYTSNFQEYTEADEFTRHLNLCEIWLSLYTDFAG